MLASEIHIPKPGFWKVRLVRNGPFVAAKIWDEAERDPETGELLEDEKLRCVVNGIERDDLEKWAEKLNCYGAVIDEAEYNYLSRVSDWAKAWAPEAPEASPMQPIDHLRSKPVF